jgi:hypothetical protein
MRELADSTREYLSGAIWWLTFFVARAADGRTSVVPCTAGTTLCRVGCTLQLKD